eukprot:SAG31_NODE_4156_length_3525_cov_2.014011_4_plen_234_part_00
MWKGESTAQEALQKLGERRANSRPVELWPGTCTGLHVEPWPGTPFFCFPFRLVSVGFGWFRLASVGWHRSFSSQHGTPLAPACQPLRRAQQHVCVSFAGLPPPSEPQPEEGLAEPVPSVRIWVGSWNAGAAAANRTAPSVHGAAARPAPHCGALCSSLSHVFGVVPIPHNFGAAPAHPRLRVHRRCRDGLPRAQQSRDVRRVLQLLCSGRLRHLRNGAARGQRTTRQPGRVLL